MNKQTSTKMINIPSYITDTYYAYRMPRLIIKPQSSGNDAKTNILNLSTVAEALNRPVECKLSN